MEEKKRDYLSIADVPYQTLETKFGKVYFQVWSGNRVNVEVRDPIIINSVAYTCVFTLKSITFGLFTVEGRVTPWGDRELSHSARAKLLDEVCKLLAARQELDAEFILANRRDVNNGIWQAEKDIAEKKQEIADLEKKREELLRKEKDFGGRIDSELQSA